MNNDSVILRPQQPNDTTTDSRKAERTNTMKRTASMKYNPTTESRELLLYTEHNLKIFDRHLMPAILNLERHAKKGVYDEQKAIDLLYYVTTAASDEYNKEFGYKFSVADRFTAAVELEQIIKADYISA